MTLPATSPHKPFFFIIQHGTDEKSRILKRGDCVPHTGNILFLADGTQAEVYMVSHAEHLGMLYATVHYKTRT